MPEPNIVTNNQEQPKPKFDLFGSLNKLFSRSVVVSLPNKGKKVIDLSKHQAIDLQSNFIIDKTSAGWTSSRLTDVMSYQTVGFNQVRTNIYQEFEQIDQDPIMAAALDIYAEEVCNKNEYNEILRIETEDQRLHDSLQTLFFDTLNLNFNLYCWVRNLCKYGDVFCKLDILEGAGITDVTVLSSYAVARAESPDKTEVKFLYDPGMANNSYQSQQSRYGQSKTQFDYNEYEVAHFRLISDINFLPYGRSVLEPARKLWKRLQLMEDALMIHRIMRAPAKRIFNIDVGNIPPAQVDTFMQQVINKMKKVPYIDNNTGQYNLQFNLMNMIEDFFIPTRGASTGNKIEQLPGLEYDGIKDIEYLQKQLFAALKIPKAYLTFEESINAKNNLIIEDIRFSKTIERIQQMVVSELTKIALVHLFTQGYRGEDLVNFELHLNAPSKSYEQQKLELWRTRVDIADSLKKLQLVSNDYIYNNVLNLSENEINEEQEKLAMDFYNNYRLEKIASSGKLPPKNEEIESEDGSNESSEPPASKQPGLKPPTVSSPNTDVGNAEEVPTEGFTKRKTGSQLLTEWENKVESLNQFLDNI